MFAACDDDDPEIRVEVSVLPCVFGLRFANAGRWCVFAMACPLYRL
jgi:hypothetical protein